MSIPEIVRFPSFDPLRQCLRDQVGFATPIPKELVHEFVDRRVDVSEVPLKLRLALGPKQKQLYPLFKAALDHCSRPVDDVASTVE